MKFRVIRSDERREPHFAVLDIPDREVPFGPPLNPTGTMTDFGAVTAMFVFSVPPGPPCQPTTRRTPYVCIILSGQDKVVTSDGETRRFCPGDVPFCDDLTGWHATGAITDLVAAYGNRATS